MIGTIANTAAIIAGSLIGGIFKKFMSERVNKSLFNAMGMAALGIGINAIVQNMPNSKYPVLFIASLAIGGAVGTLLKLDERLNGISLKKEEDDSNGLMQGLITGCLLFCIGTLSILGPVQSALYKDYTYLFTNATLDFVSSMVLASTYGIGMCLAAGVLFLWQGGIYLSTLALGNFISGTMMCELSIVGGFLIAMSGISILELKNMKTVNYLPALIIPVIFCLVIG